jgi:hypothetical protein
MLSTRLVLLCFFVLLGCSAFQLRLGMPVIPIKSTRLAVGLVVLEGVRHPSLDQAQVRKERLRMCIRRRARNEVKARLVA